MQACVGLGGRLGWVSESFVSALIPQMFIEHLLRVGALSQRGCVS